MQKDMEGGLLVCNDALAGILSRQNFNSNSTFYTNLASYQKYLKTIIPTKENVDPKIVGGEVVKDFSKFAYQVKNKNGSYIKTIFSSNVLRFSRYRYNIEVIIFAVEQLSMKFTS